MKVVKSRFAPLLVIATYVAIQSIAITAPWFPSDDGQEIAFVRSFECWWQAFGVDAFGLFRPFKNLLFLAFIALEPLGMHWVHLLAMAVGVLSFFPVRAFFRLALGDDRLALLAAAIWMLSPTLVSSAAWLSCVNIQLMCAFAAASFVCHDRGRPFGAVAFLLLACASYECAVAVGPVIVAFDFFLRPERVGNRRMWLVYAFYAMATIVFLVMRQSIGSVTSVAGCFAGTDRVDAIVASAYFTCQHFLAWLWPFGRMAVSGGYVKGSVSTWILACSWLVVFSSAILSLTIRRVRPVVALGVSISLVGFLPVSNVTGVGNGPYGDYYLGISSMGLALVLVDVLRIAWPLRRRVRLLAIAVVVAIAVSRTIAVVEAARWAALWTDADRAFEENERTFPNSFLASTFRAQLACDAGDWQKALECCDRVEAIVGTNSVKLAPALIVKALVAINATRSAEDALSAIDAAMSLPDVGDTVIRECRFYRGCVYEDLLNDNAKAEIEYASAIPKVWNCDTVQPADRLARLLALRGEYAAAVDLWIRALKLQPENRHMANNLSVVRKWMQQPSQGK